MSSPLALGTIVQTSVLHTARFEGGSAPVGSGTTGFVASRLSTSFVGIMNPVEGWHMNIEPSLVTIIAEMRHTGDWIVIVEGGTEWRIRLSGQNIRTRRQQTFSLWYESRKEGRI